MKLGIIDSGIGGYVCASKVRKAFTMIDLVILMDHKNLPYGSKSTEELLDILKMNIDFMKKNSVDAIFLACNTLSCIYYDHKEVFQGIKVYTMFDFYEEIKEHIYSDVALLGTVYTANSSTIKKVLPSKFVEFIGAPNLAKIIEEHQLEQISEDLKTLNLPNKPIILGCTHYPIAADEIKKITEKPTLDPMTYLLNVMDFKDEGNHQNIVYINGDFKPNPEYVKLINDVEIENLDF